MTRRTALLIAAVGAALVVPGNAAAVDHVTLFISPTKLSQSGWKLSAAVVGATSPGARETFGLSLTRTLGNGRGEEQHGLRAAPSGTVSFDGRSWPLGGAVRHSRRDRHDRDRDRPGAGGR